MTKNLSRAEAAGFLLAHDNFCILTHGRPDGDTIGSAATLCLGLRQLGKTAYVLENAGTTPFLSRCTMGLTLPDPAEGDTLVAVDVASPGMLPEAHRIYTDRIDLRIDHHGSATSFTPVELVDSDAAACGEIIYDVLMLMGAKLTKDMAWRLYIAVSTDTGCFRYANTNAHSYLVAAACAETGADLYPITQELFDTNTMGKLRLQSYIVENARFFCGGKAAVCAIPKELEDSVTREDMEGVPGFLRSIEGVKISATIRLSKECCKMSVRAVPGFDASAVCAKFGGGGHKKEAGFTIENITIEETEICVTMTFGVACDATLEIEELIELADDKLYEGKSAGRNCIIF